MKIRLEKVSKAKGLLFEGVSKIDNPSKTEPEKSTILSVKW